MRTNRWFLIAFFWLGMPIFASAQLCTTAAEPWQSVRSTWQASWQVPLSLELRQQALNTSAKAGILTASVERLVQSWWLQVGALSVALLSALALLLSWRAMRHGGWRMALLALGLAVLSLTLGYMREASDLWLMVQSSDVRTAPNGAAATISQIPTGSVGSCKPAPTDPAFCLWHSAQGPQGWIETRNALSLMEACIHY